MSSPSPSPTPCRSSLTSPRKSINGRMRPAPYMVALSGWPEPVYIDSGKLAALSLDDDGVTGPVGRRGSQGSLRSALGTPRGSSNVKAAPEKDGRQSPSEGRSRSGTPTSNCRPNVKGGSSLGLGRVINQDIYPYLHSSTPPPDPMSPGEQTDTDLLEARLASPLPLYPNNPTCTKHPHTPPSNTTVRPPLNPQTAPSGSSSTRAQSRFADPRFTPRASVIGQQGAHLRVVPSWSNSSSSPKTEKDNRYTSIWTSETTDIDMEAPTPPRPAQTEMPPPPLPAKVSSIGVGGRYLQLGLSQGKAKAAILRSTPEVYPPPSSGSMGSGHGGTGSLAGLNGIPGLGGMATEVYPRDPESGVFWKNARQGTGEGGERGLGGMSRTGGEMSRAGWEILRVGGEKEAEEGMIVDN